MLFIGICGASGSGKSTLAEELATMVNKSILIINQVLTIKIIPI